MTSGFLDTTGGLRLFHRIAEVDAPRGAVVLIHGFAEHGGRYGHVSAALNEAGFTVVSIDLRGHGASEGRRGYVERFDDYLGDVDVAVRKAVEQTPSAPVFLLGHSMGGLVCSLFASRNPEGLAGLIVSSPALGFALEVPAWKRVAGRFFSRVHPSMALPSGVDPKVLSHDAAVVAAYEKDPLVFHKATARWYTEMVDAMARAKAVAPAMRLPLLLLVAGADRLVDPKASRAFHDAYGGDDRTLHVYEGLFHEVFNEVERDRVIGDLVDWLLAH